MMVNILKLTLSLLLCLFFPRLFPGVGQGDGSSYLQHQQHDRTGALHTAGPPLAAPGRKGYSPVRTGSLLAASRHTHHLSLLCSAACAQRHMHTLNNIHTNNYELYAHTHRHTHTHTQSTSGPPCTHRWRTSQTYLQHCVHFLHQLAKNTEQFRNISHLRRHRTGRSIKNCNTGKNTSLSPYVIYRHSYKTFEVFLSLRHGSARQIIYYQYTKNGVLVFRLLWLLTFSFTLFHQSTSHEHQRCFKMKVSLYHFCALYVSYRKTNGHSSYLNKLFFNFPFYFLL